MSDTPVDDILRRLDRICHAVGLGFEAAADDPRPLVVQAMVATMREAVRLGHALTQQVAYDDLWDDLDDLVERWRTIEGAGLQAQILDIDARALTQAAGEAMRCLADIRDAAAQIDRAQVELLVRPGDQVVLASLGAAIGRLEAAADQAFVEALGEDVLGRLDAGMAVLTSCAARASRERTSIRLRGGSH